MQSLELFFKQAVNETVSSEMNDVGPPRLRQGTRTTEVNSFSYRIVFHENKKVECSLFKKLELMLRQKVVRGVVARFGAVQQVVVTSFQSKLKYYKRLLSREDKSDRTGRMESTRGKGSLGEP